MASYETWARLVRMPAEPMQTPPWLSIEYASPRLTIALVDDVHIAVHGRDNPDAQDWDAYLKTTHTLRSRHENVRALVYTLGGNPSSAQRSALNKVNEGFLAQVSVMLESRLARGAVTALSWFNPRIKAFALGQVDDALAHLALSGTQASRVKEALEALKIALAAARS